MSQFLEIDDSLRRVLKVLGASFSASEVKEVCDFLDVGEYGIALETICGIIAEERKSITSEVQALIGQIGTRMGMDSQLWNDLRERTT
jgi:hypothetical protein